MLVKTEAIVLRMLKYGDQRNIVDMFTREQGHQAFIVTVPKTGRGRLKRQYFQPLTLLAIEADLRPTVQLQKLRDASLLAPLSSLHDDVRKLSLSLFLSEFLFHALKGEQQNGPLFQYVANSMEWLDGCREQYANFHLVFLMRLSRFLGFWPNLEGSRQAGLFFDLRSATFTAAAPLHSDFLQPEEAAVIGTLMRMDYASMHLFRLTRQQRTRILELLLLYYRLHVPEFPELRSPEVLHELFA